MRVFSRYTSNLWVFLSKIVAFDLSPLCYQGRLSPRTMAQSFPLPSPALIFFFLLSLAFSCPSLPYPLCPIHHQSHTKIRHIRKHTTDLDCLSTGVGLIQPSQFWGLGLAPITVEAGDTNDSIKRLALRDMEKIIHVAVWTKSVMKWWFWWLYGFKFYFEV
jgi:hypothetical protein